MGIEHIPELAEFSIQNLRKSYSKQLDDKSILIVCGDGRLGYPTFAPYAVIHVGAAADGVPKPLLE